MTTAIAMRCTEMSFRRGGTQEQEHGEGYRPSTQGQRPGDEAREDGDGPGGPGERGPRAGRCRLQAGLEPLAQPAAVVPGRGQLGSVAQDDDDLAARPGMGGANAVEVHDRRAADSQEALRVEPLRAALDRAADQVRFRTDVESEIVSRT